MVLSPTATFSLPIPPDSFVGRGSELDTLHRMLASGVRLITLTGPGGVGKTRLALEVCAREAIFYPHGICFVTLEAISDAEYVLPEIARGLSVELSGTAPPLEDLVSALTGKRLLLCIDNWEHLIEAAVQIIPLLTACPDLQIIATSREALRLRGEQVFPVEPLLLPSPGSSFKPEAAAEAQAVQLFVERARAVRPGFELDRRNAPAVVEICSLLDGLPLAVELAAALLRLFSPQALLARVTRGANFARLSGTIDLLAGGPRDLPARQQTLRQTLDWSYSLLDGEEQRVFRRLAVFAGGCDLAAAKAVCAPESGASRPLLDLLLALADNSLLRVSQIDGEPRFKMLKVIQEYAAQGLESRDEATDAYRRHARHFLRLAERAAPELKGHDHARWFRRLDQEQDNFRVVLAKIRHTDDDLQAARLAAELAYFWYVRGYTREGSRVLEGILSGATDQLETQLHIRLLHGAGMMSICQGEYLVAKSHYELKLDLARRIEDWEGVQRALSNLGIIADTLGEFEASRAYYQQALNLARRLEKTASHATILIKLGVMAYAQGEPAEAEVFFRQSLLLKESVGDPNGIAIAAGFLGRLASYRGDYDAAKPFLERALAVAEGVGDTRTVAHVLNELGIVAGRQGAARVAALHFRRSLNVARELAEKATLLEIMRSFAEFECKYGSPARAAQLWGFEEKERVEMGIVISLAHVNYHRGIVEEIRRNLGAEAMAHLLSVGRRMDFTEAVAFALASPALAEQSPEPTQPRSVPPAVAGGLTQREREVLRLVAQGMSDGQVAGALIISPRTINAHLTSIYSKLGVNSRVAATRFAIENKLVD